MVTFRCACRVGWVLASCLPLNAFAQPSAAAVSLTLNTAQVYAIGEPIEFSVVLTNRGATPLSVFRPRWPQLQWSDWSIGCQVTNPTGHMTKLVPAILYSRMPIPEQGDVVELSQGETVEMVLILTNQDSVTPPLRDDALVLALAIPLSQAQEEMTTEALRQQFGIEGRFALVGGGDAYLEIADVSRHVFNTPGSYQLECHWFSAITDVWLPGARNTLVPEAVDGLWVGEVSGEAELEIGVSVGDRGR